jgi:hypothetical protein
VAVEVNHNIELSGLSDFSTKLEDMARTIQESFSQFAHTLNTAPDRMQQEKEKPKETRHNTILDNKDLIKSNEQLRDVMLRLTGVMGAVNYLNGKDLEPNRREQTERSAKITAGAIGTVLGATLYKLGSQYENLGGTIGQQFQSINQTAGSSKQFLQSQYNSQTSAKTEMAKTAISGGGAIAGALAGARVGAIGGSLFGPWGTAIGGITGAGAGLLGANYINADLNKDLARKQASYTYGLNNADTAFRLNMSGRYGMQGTATGKQFTLPGMQGASGAMIGGGTYRMTPLQQQLQMSPFANNAEQIIGGLRGNVSGMNLAKTVNQIGVSAMANNIPEGQWGQFATQVQSISKYANKDMKDVLVKINENQVKYGGDTVQNLGIVQKLLQTSAAGDFDKLMDYVSKNQQNPMSIQTRANWEGMDPTSRYQLQMMGKMFGVDTGKVLREGFSAGQVRKLGDWTNPEKSPNEFLRFAGILAASGSTTVGQLVKGFKPLPTDASAIANLTDRPLSEVTPPSTQEFMKVLQDSLSNLNVTTMNVQASNISFNGSQNEGGTYVAPPPSAPTNIRNHNGIGINSKSKSTSSSDLMNSLHKTRSGAK